MRSSHPETAEHFQGQTLTEMHERVPKRVDPRQYSDFGLPGDVELAAEIDGDEGIEAGTFVHPHPDDVRVNSMIRADASSSRARAPRAAWQEWRAFGKRHGIEHPEQTQDRIRRHEAGQDARTRRIDSKAASGVQDRFDGRTIGHVATRAAESRALNARHVDRPPAHEPQAFSFEGEMITGSFYRQGRGDGHRAKYSAYAWDLRDGW
jgi:hypothetical protein